MALHLNPALHVVPSQHASSRPPHSTHVLVAALQVNPSSHTDPTISEPSLMSSSQQTSSRRPHGSHMPMALQMNPALHVSSSQHTSMLLRLSGSPPHTEHVSSAGSQMEPVSHKPPSQQVSEGAPQD
eukprot:CAMPEP_0178660324 /NCGR_PEP_ID=MMETSP0698-20121128/27062_1 /TAXON_ID=265572 /ORGANISM="Extubocellulus spinifer, Strain CCMP396" /LENGTH=126 /DNA_ID=CAMNT_0020302969 /DNA_START=233 /DNA_END=613 /DNA_ORIENTATION=-